MTISPLLLVTICALGVVTIALFVLILARPHARRRPEVELHTKHCQDIRDRIADDRVASADLFEQFELAVMEAEYGFERRRSAREMLTAITIADSTTLIAPDETYDPATLTRAELLELRARQRE